MVSVSITELIWQAKTREEIQTWSGKSEVGRFSTQPLLNTQWDISYVALPKTSTRCQPSLETWMRLLLWCGAGWELFESVVWQRARSWSHAFHMIATCIPWLFYRQWNSPAGTLLKIYDKNILQNDSILSLKWSKTCNITLWSFCPTLCWTCMSVWKCVPNALTKVATWT